MSKPIPRALSFLQSIPILDFSNLESLPKSFTISDWGWQITCHYTDVGDWCWRRPRNRHQDNCDSKNQSRIILSLTSLCKFWTWVSSLFILSFMPFMVIWMSFKVTCPFANPFSKAKMSKNSEIISLNWKCGFELTQGEGTVFLYVQWVILFNDLSSRSYKTQKLKVLKGKYFRIFTSQYVQLSFKTESRPFPTASWDPWSK